MQKRLSILFISAGDSARSQMAAGFLRKLVGDYFDISTVGIEPANTASQVGQAMKEIGIDIAGEKSKTPRESLKQHFAYVVSIADAARERSPIFPFTQHLFKWHTANPSIADERGREPLDKYREARDQIRTKVHGLVRHLARNREITLPRAA